MPVVPESFGNTEVAFEFFFLHPVQFVFFETGEELDDAVWVETFNDEACFAGSVACVEDLVPLVFDVVVDAFDEEVHQDSPREAPSFAVGRRSSRVVNY